MRLYSKVKVSKRKMMSTGKSHSTPLLQLLLLPPLHDVPAISRVYVLHVALKQSCCRPRYGYSRRLGRPSLYTLPTCNGQLQKQAIIQYCLACVENHSSLGRFRLIQSSTSIPWLAFCDSLPAFSSIQVLAVSRGGCKRDTGTPADESDKKAK